MASTRLECDSCGNKGFSTKAELASRRRSSYCWAGPQRKARHDVSKKCKATAEGAAQEHTTIQDGASVHQNVLKNDEVVGPKEYRYSQDSTMLLAMTNKDSTSDDSTRRLVDWIRSCHNGKGLSKQGSQNFLDVLRHP